MRRVVLFVLTIVVASGCSTVLGITDFESDQGRGGSDARADDVLHKGDGPPCKFDDPNATFDRSCTFAP